MKSRLLILCFLIILPAFSIAQVSDSIYYNRLFYVGKLWGHVKYYHAEVARGNIDWDNELIQALEDIKAAPDNDAFNNSLLSLLDRAGELGDISGSKPSFPDSLNNNTDLSWIQSEIFSDSVQTILENIWDRFSPQDNVYVTAGSASNPTFGNDNGLYESAHYPKEQERIMALFRYWNIINYFFPYKYIMDQDWDTSLIEFIPSIVEAQDELAYNLAFKEFTTRINDSHAFFSSPTYSRWLGNSHPPFQVRWIEEEMVVTKVLPEVDGLKPGDIIKAMDGVEIKTLRDSLRKYAHASNPTIVERELNSIITWGIFGDFSLKIENETGIHDLSLERNGPNFQLLRENTSPIWRKTKAIGGCDFGVVDMGRLEREDVGKMFDDLWETDAIIFDIRNYPNGTLWEIVKYLFFNNVHVASFTVPDRRFPGALNWIDAKLAASTSKVYEGNVVILFDERTQSQAEYTCMGLEQFDGSVKIGSTTSAADGNVSWIYLPGNIRTAATFLGTYYPDYSPTQRIGILPDYEVKPTINGIRAGRDEVLEFALNCDFARTNTSGELQNVLIYPNPGNEIMRYDAALEGIELIELFDVMGRKVLSSENNLASGVIDISNLAQGTYLIRFYTKEGNVARRFVKI